MSLLNGVFAKEECLKQFKTLKDADHFVNRVTKEDAYYDGEEHFVEQALLKAVLPDVEL